MAEKPTVASSSAEAHPITAPVTSDMAQDAVLLSPEDGAGAKKGQGHLQVPSRSSSQKNQSSPTSTGLSGATVSESRNSVSDRSKDSQGSTTGRQRNGSASSNRTGGETEPTNTAGNTQPNSPSANPPKKRKGGFLSFLGCCVAPDTSNSGDEETENVHKLDRLPQRPMTSKAKPSTQHEDQLSKPLNEKDAQPQGTSGSRDQRAQTADNQDEITAAQNENRESQPPAVKVDPPKSRGLENEPQSNGKHVGDDDSAMDDALPEDPQSSIITQVSEDAAGRTIPPPPPPASGSPVATPLSEDIPSVGEPQKALLGPIRPEHQGRKCLVLDLDETLVHSSFKVSILG